ncbi:MAG: glutamate racemase [Verrucomicrobiota bacterium]
MGAPADELVDRVVNHARAHPEGDAPASFRASDYRGDLSDLPIGVFDSGVGGLTVLEAIKAHDRHDNRTGAEGPDGIPDFQGERFIYLGDQANMPYGNYAAAGRTDFLRELILRDALFLLGRRHLHGEKPPVKAVVIACNTATAYGLEDLRAAFKAWGLPVILVGVVEAGAKGLQETAKGAQGGVAVMATVGTCASKAYPRAISQVTDRPVRQLGSATLAAAIEGDPSVKASVRDIIRTEVGDFLKEAAASAPDRPFDTVVLGCTHYPLVAEEIHAAFAHWRDHRASDGSRPYERLVAPRLLQVDPAAWTAEELWRALKSSDRFSRSARQGDAFFISVPAVGRERLGSDGGLARDYKYGRPAGDVMRTDTVVVPLRPEMLPGSAATLVRERLPLTWRSLQSAR